jgi:hypothetical protein
MSFSSSFALSPDGTGSPVGVGLPSAADLLDFQQIASGIAPPASPLAPKSLTPLSSEDGERVNAAIVIVLTLACTALSFFDLFLLAYGW